MIAIFWPIGNCSFQIFGKGSMQIDISVKIFTIAYPIVSLSKLKHFPSYVQNALIGEQLNIAINNIIVTQTDITIICAYTI